MIVVIVLIATLVESKIDADDAKYSNKNNNNNNNNNGMQMKETKKNGSKSGGDTQITVMSSEYSGKGFKDGLEIMKESELTSSGRKCPSEQSKQSTLQLSTLCLCDVNNPTSSGIFTKFLLCFSLISNGKAIMCLKTPSKVDNSSPSLPYFTITIPFQDSLTSIHGIRLFSLLWTIMVHTYLQFFALSENRVS